jgi:hypothetical protein
MRDTRFAAPTQVEQFFRSQRSVPTSWSGAVAAQAFIDRDLNPGLAVGILGAETSFGGGPRLSPRNIRDPFHSGGHSFEASARRAAHAVDRILNATRTPNTPLEALVNGQNDLRGPGRPGFVYTATQQQLWVSNVNFWFRAFVRFLGKCR